MRPLSFVRVETARLLRARTTWLFLGAASLCPLAGYSLYQPAGEGTTAALVLANPLLAGALGGMFLFGVLTLFELDRVRKGGMEAIANSIVSPLGSSAAKTAALLLTAGLSALLTFLLYLPYTWFRLGAAFSFGEYSKFAGVFLLPALGMGVLASAAFYLLFRRADLSLVCLGALLLAGVGPWNGGTYLLYWIDLSGVGFSGDLGNTALYRMALYSRLLWLCLFGGLWVLALLCVRTHGKGVLGSLRRNGRRICLPLLALALLAGGVGMYCKQPYLDHEAPVAMDTGGVTGGGMSATVSGAEEEAAGLTIRKTQFDLRLDAQGGSMEGEARYQVENAGGEQRECLLEISPGYTVDRVTANGAEIPFTDLDNDYFILTKNIALTLPAQQEMEVVVQYHGSPQIPANTGVLTLYYEITPEYISLGGQTVLPSFQGAAEEDCTHSGQVTLPTGMELIATGETAKPAGENQDGTTTWQVQGSGLRPVLFGGNYTRVRVPDMVFPVYFCYSRTHAQEFEELDVVDLLQQTLSYCVENYGPLPYSEEYPLNIVMSSAHMMGGGASDNLSFMGESFFSAANLADPSKGASAAEVIAHEIIHQWWGIQRYLMDEENPDWSSEALTCYTTYRMMKAEKGADYGKEHYLDVWQEKYETMQNNFYVQNPEYLAMLPEKHQAALSAMLFDANTYGKAPLQVYKAQQLVGGEEAMDEILNGLFQTGGTELPPFLTWQDFLDACGLTEEQLALEGGEDLG